MLFSLLVGFCKKWNVGWFFWHANCNFFLSTSDTSTEFTNITKWNAGKSTDTKKCQCLGVLQAYYFAGYSRATGLCSNKKAKDEKKILARCFGTSNPRHWVLSGGPQISFQWAPVCCWSHLGWAVDLSKQFQCVLVQTEEGFQSVSAVKMLNPHKPNWIF